MHTLRVVTSALLAPSLCWCGSAGEGSLPSVLAALGVLTMGCCMWSQLHQTSAPPQVIPVCTRAQVPGWRRHVIGTWRCLAWQDSCREHAWCCAAPCQPTHSERPELCLCVGSTPAGWLMCQWQWSLNADMQFGCRLHPVCSPESCQGGGMGFRSPLPARVG